MKILITNTEKLKAAIKEAEGRATARTVKADDIEYIIGKVSKGIAKAKLSGTKVYYSGAEHFPNAYKYRPESTHWTAENINGRWYVIDIFRGICPNRINNTMVEYSDAAKAAIIDKASFCCY